MPGRASSRATSFDTAGAGTLNARAAAEEPPRSAEGEEFDQRSGPMQVAAHEKAAASFENGEEPGQQAFADATLPRRQEHLEDIRGIARPVTDA